MLIFRFVWILGIQKDYQYLVGGLLNWVMHSFYLIHGWFGIRNHYGLCPCLFSPVTSSKVIIIFNLLFLAASSILLCTLFQGRYHKDMRRLRQALAFFYHHLHWVQSYWPFQWINCVPHSWAFIEIRILLFYSSGTFFSLRILFLVSSHTSFYPCFC